MTYIDVLIPAFGGILALTLTNALVKPSGNPAKDASRKRLLRIAGIVLLGVAALYLVIKLAGH